MFDLTELDGDNDRSNEVACSETRAAQLFFLPG